MKERRRVRTGKGETERDMDNEDREVERWREIWRGRTWKGETERDMDSEDRERR